MGHAICSIQVRRGGFVCMPGKLCYTGGFDSLLVPAEVAFLVLASHMSFVLQGPRSFGANLPLALSNELQTQMPCRTWAVSGNRPTSRQRYVSPPRKQAADEKEA
jgi:hypothetical protein